VGFGPTIPVFERPKAVRVSDRSATGNGTKYYQGNKIKENEMGRHVARIVEMRKPYNTFVGKPEGKILLE
jgi:hypothetical protein